MRVLVEGVVIVASILLAFGIDAWWEDRQDRVREGEYLVRLAEDLHADTTELAQVVRAWERNAQSAAVLRASLRAGPQRVENDPAAILAHASVLLMSTNRLAAVLAITLTPLMCLAFCRRLTVTAAVVISSLVAVMYLAVDPALRLVDRSALAVAQSLRRDHLRNRDHGCDSACGWNARGLSAPVLGSRLRRRDGGRLGPDR